MTDAQAAPSTLERFDPVQEGAPRTIHPIGEPEPIRVGSPRVYQEQRPMDRPDTYHIVKKSVIKQSRNGKSSMQFAEGTKVPAHVAYEYGLIGDEPTLTVRTDEEAPATAPDDPVFTRAEGAAPENRMETAPQNRAEGGEGLTPQQKAAQTRAANKAAQEAAGSGDEDGPADGDESE